MSDISSQDTCTFRHRKKKIEINRQKDREGMEEREIEINRDLEEQTDGKVEKKERDREINLYLDNQIIKQKKNKLHKKKNKQVNNKNVLYLLKFYFLILQLPKLKFIFHLDRKESIKKIQAN